MHISVCAYVCVCPEEEDEEEEEEEGIVDTDNSPEKAAPYDAGVYLYRRRRE